jgi:Inositol polyphosphate kinase
MSHLKLPPLPPYQKQRHKSYAGFPLGSQQNPASVLSSSFQLVVSTPISSANNLNRTMAANQKLPDGYVVMEQQVAGHTFQVGADKIGMLRSIDDGSVLKPGGNPMCAAREIKFYEQLLTTTDKDILPLREFTTEFRGTQKLSIGSKTVNFIKLRDLTHGMLEPCVMDIKIGQRTWDPLATEQKREAEESKYQICRKTLGFCIPGFHFSHLASGNFKKFGRDYGKKLNENTVKDGKFSIKIFKYFHIKALFIHSLIHSFILTNVLAQLIPLFY